MDTFAFIIHPIDPKRDIGRKFPWLARIVNDWQIYHWAPHFPPVYLSEVEGITSIQTGKMIKGWLIACPLIPRHFLELSEEQVYRKIIQTGRLAEKLGANILGLGAFTSVVGDAGQTIARHLDIPVTTGDSYTVAVAIQTIYKAAEVMNISLQSSKVAVVGATGSLGRVCAELLAGNVAEMILIGRSQASLQSLSESISFLNPSLGLETSTNMEALREAQLVITVTSAMDAIIEPEHLQPGCVVCDVALPRDVSMKVSAQRTDVLVIDSGIVDVPGPINFHFNFGLPPGKAYACMAETMALALEGRFEDYTIGKNIRLDQVKEISTIADRHGFRLNGFRSFEKPVTEEQINRVRQNAQFGRRHS